ncbi:MAG TPA: hypothetical protein VMH35_13410 [Streptosporangiaceae bacterium]|nr:hypothetical protein [Streptosporangiaceae bacterium]
MSTKIGGPLIRAVPFTQRARPGPGLDARPGSAGPGIPDRD